MKKKVIGTVIIICIILIFILSKYFGYSKKNTDNGDIFVEDKKIVTENINNQQEIKVYVNGEVKCPGVYTLKSGSRVEEAVLKAGGFTQDADKISVNMAKKLKDEDYVIIGNKNVKEKVSSAAVSNPQLVNSISSGSDKVDINSATKEQLKTIPGIGDITAQKIIDYREKNGPFKSIQDLKKVGRIGDKTIEKIKEKIEVR